MKDTTNKILTVFVFSILYVFTACVVILILPFAYLRAKWVVKNILLYWAISIFWLMGKRIVIHGRNNYSRKKHYIILANHSSLFDIMAIMALYPDVVWFGHYRLMKIPVFNQILKMINYIPLREKGISNTKSMINEITERSKNHTIAIFPEGTRTMNGQMKDFFRGFIIALKASDSEILPVTLNGFFQLKPKPRWYIDFGAKLEIFIHQSISRDKLINRSDQEIMFLVKSIIEARLTPYNIQPIQMIKE